MLKQLTWRNRLGYPAHTGSISLSILLSICLSIRLEYQNTQIFNVGIKMKKSHQTVNPSLRIPILTLLYCKFVSNTKNCFLPQPKTDTMAHHMSIAEYTRCAWAEGNFFRCLRKVPPAHAQWVQLPSPHRLISPSVHLEQKKTQILNVGIKIRVYTWSHLSVLSPLKIHTPMFHHVLYSKYGSKTENHFPPQQKTDTTAQPGKVPPAHVQQVLTQYKAGGTQ